MISEKFVSEKLEELKKLNVKDSIAGLKLQYFCAIADVIREEASNEHKNITGIYKEFRAAYYSFDKLYYDNLVSKLDRDLEILRTLH